MSRALPLRVLVKGPSTVNWTSWMGGPRTDFAFPRVLEEQLLASGRPCEVRAITSPSEKTAPILATWQQEVLGYSPDVIVLLVGQYETIHLILPRWLERHANSLRSRPRWWSNLYRSLFLRPLWRALAQVQARLDTIVPPNIWRRERRVVADLERYIEHVQKVGSPMVLLFEFIPPGERFWAWFPGMKARLEVMNEAIEGLVRRLDVPHVRYFRVAHIAKAVSGGEPELATPDGFHYTPEMHRALGVALAEEINEWAETQPHLAGVRRLEP